MLNPDCWKNLPMAMVQKVVCIFFDGMTIQPTDLKHRDQSIGQYEIPETRSGIGFLSDLDDANEFCTKRTSSDNAD
jgi:hypothetical protein